MTKKRKWKGYFRIKLCQYNVYYNEDENAFVSIERATVYKSKSKALLKLEELLDIDYGYIIERFYLKS